MTRSFALVGLSHKTAPVSVRERLAVPANQLADFVAELRKASGAEESLLVLTCNRVEAYVFGPPESVEGAVSFLAEKGGPEARNALYVRPGDEAIAHLFRVASSLDSMVLGEPQILGQVKDAFGAAQKAGAAGAAITRICQAAFSAAKRVRTETAIGSAPVSMASASVDLARKIFGSLEGKKVLVIGAGEMSELAAKHLSQGSGTITVTNRTFEKAEALAKDLPKASARRFEELATLLAEADIVISSTAAQEPIITAPLVHGVMKARRYRPLFFVDLAVPRDVDEAVGKVDGVYAYDVDDLAAVATEGRKVRELEAAKAEAILRDELEKYRQVKAAREGMPVIAALRAHADAVAHAELEKTLMAVGEGLTEKQKRSVEAMGRAIVNKLLHAPTQRLREANKAGPEAAAALAVVVAELFDVDPSQPPPPKKDEDKK